MQNIYTQPTRCLLGPRTCTKGARQGRQTQRFWAAGDSEGAEPGAGSQHRSTGRALCWTWDFSSGVWCSLDFETVMRQSGRQRGLFCTWNSKLASHRKKDTHSHSFTWGWSARGRMWTHWVTTTPFSKEKLPKLMVQSIVNRKSCELRSDFYASQTDLSANLLCSLNAGILISFYQEKLHFFQEICAQYFS